MLSSKEYIRYVNYGRYASAAPLPVLAQVPSTSSKAGQPVNLTLRMVPATVAVGTRRADRTVLESAMLVDVVDMCELTLTAPQTDVTQLLTYVVPSFNPCRET